MVALGRDRRSASISGEGVADAETHAHRRGSDDSHDGSSRKHFAGQSVERKKLPAITPEASPGDRLARLADQRWLGVSDHLLEQRQVFQEPFSTCGG